MNKKTNSPLKRAGALALAALCALVTSLGLVATFGLALVQNTLLSPGFFTGLVTDDYLQQLTAFINEDLADECPVYGLDEQVVLSCVDAPTLKASALEYVQKLQRMLTGTLAPGETDRVEYSATHFAPVAQSVRENLGPDEELDEPALQQLTQLLADIVSYDLNAFHTSFLGKLNVAQGMGKIGVLFQSHGMLYRALTVPFWVPLLVSLAALTGVFFLTGRKKLTNRLYNLATLLWVVFTLLYIPLCLFSALDVPARLVLSPSPFKSLLDALLYALTHSLLTPVAVCFWLATAGVVALVTLQLMDSSRKLWPPVSPQAPTAPEIPEPSQAAPVAEPKAKPQPDDDSYPIFRE